MASNQIIEPNDKVRVAQIPGINLWVITRPPAAEATTTVWTFRDANYQTYEQINPEVRLVQKGLPIAENQIEKEVI